MQLSASFLFLFLDITQLRSGHSWFFALVSLVGRTDYGMLGIKPRLAMSKVSVPPITISPVPLFLLLLVLLFFFFHTWQYRFILGSACRIYSWYVAQGTILNVRDQTWISPMLASALSIILLLWPLSPSSFC